MCENAAISMWQPVATVKTLSQSSKAIQTLFNCTRTPACLYLCISLSLSACVCEWVSVRYTLCWYINDDFSFFVRVDWIAWFNTLLRTRPIAVVYVPVAASITLYLELHLHLCSPIEYSFSFSFGWGESVNFVIQLTRPLCKLTIIFNFLFYYYLFAYSAQLYCMFTETIQTNGRMKCLKSPVLIANKCENYNSTCKAIFRAG